VTLLFLLATWVAWVALVAAFIFYAPPRVLRAVCAGLTALYALPAAVEVGLGTADRGTWYFVLLAAVSCWVWRYYDRQLR